MRFLYVLFFLLLLIGCKGEEATTSPDIEYLKCKDGRKVTDIKLCDIQDPEPVISTPDVSAEDAKMEVVDQTGKEVASEFDARTAFEVWAQGKQYEFVSAEPFLQKDKRYYKVIYRHFEVSGGKRQVFIDESGGVFEQMPVI